MFFLVSMSKFSINWSIYFPDKGLFQFLSISLIGYKTKLLFSKRGCGISNEIFLFKIFITSPLKSTMSISHVLGALT